MMNTTTHDIDPAHIRKMLRIHPNPDTLAEGVTPRDYLRDRLNILRISTDASGPCSLARIAKVLGYKNQNFLDQVVSPKAKISIGPLLAYRMHNATWGFIRSDLVSTDAILRSAL